ncbi:MAG: glycoside hydrolase family 43 protein [Clostridiales bacterium]|nr:glycoside hydrolase family 43 protein [Clostridiales bacterium]
MKKILINIVTLALISLQAVSCSGAGLGQTTGRSEGCGLIELADPTIYVYDGKYYLTGTAGNSNMGFDLYESDDLQNWKHNSRILTKGDGVYGTKGFWAPQLIEIPGAGFRLAYTANEQVAMAQSADGRLVSRYVQPVVEPLDSSAKNIDPFIFRDDDGRYYLYHVRFNKGNYLWVAEYDPATGRIDNGTLRQCLECDQAWENTGDYPSDPIMEGPTVIKMDGTYYLFYSANHFMSRDYAVGYATSSSPVGPWVKSEGNPIISRHTVGENGAGHGDVFKDLDGNIKYVYHVHNSDTVVSPRTTRIVELQLSPGTDEGAPREVKALPSTVITPKLVE